jgi:hypothetical protein
VPPNAMVGSEMNATAIIQRAALLMAGLRMLFGRVPGWPR